MEDAAERVKEKVWGYEENVGESADEETIEHKGTMVEERNVENEGTTEDKITTEEEETIEEFIQVKMWAVKELSRCRMRTGQRTGILRGVSGRRAVSEPVDI